VTPGPCGSGAALGACCGRLHAGEPAPTAEALMRSRYTAFVLGDEAYLRRTWHRSTRPRRLDVGSDAGWAGLEIEATELGGPDDDEGVVVFRARHRDGVLAERSRFRREAGVWFYLDGDVDRDVEQDA
jgi:SEC-C motif domain protein